MKYSIVLQGRTYECTKLVQQRYGLDDQTLRKWAKYNIVPTPVRLCQRTVCPAIAGPSFGRERVSGDPLGSYGNGVR